MEAFYRKKRQWEFENEQRLVIVANQASDRIQSVGVLFLQLTSFLLFVLYKVGRLGWILFYGILMGPRLVRQVGPGEIPEEIQNFEYIRLHQIPTRRIR